MAANGLMLEVHNAPERALSDGAQSLYPEQFDLLCREVKTIHDNPHHQGEHIRSA
jgi:3-deoxy-7-phosphoheptulonate synthase